MAESIESFVTKLQAEGVQAGKEAAEKLRAEAKIQADEILSRAKQEAERIVADAKAQAERTLERSRTELDLAARDAVLTLAEALNRCMQALIARRTERVLDDVEFLGRVLHEIITLYAQADLEGKPTIRIDVKSDVRDKLVDWALREIGKEAADGQHAGIDLKGRLTQAGFEYNVSGATIEVTRDSVVEMLSEMVSPKLREVIQQAAAGQGGS